MRIRLGFLCLFISLFINNVNVNGRERTFCEGDNCTDNNFAIRFGDIDQKSSSIRADMGEMIDITVTTDVVDVAGDMVQGWSIAVAHPTDSLNVISVTIDELDLPAEFFNTTTLAVGDPAPGFIAAYVTAIFPAPGDFLQPGENIPLAKATYEVIAKLDQVDPVFLEFVNDTLIPNEGSPPTSNNFTISSATRRPKKVIDGEVRGKEVIVDPGDVPFIRGDANGSGTVNLTDAILVANNIFAQRHVFFDCKDMLDANDDGNLDSTDPVTIINWFYNNGPAIPEPFDVCGLDPTDDGLDCVHSNCDCDNFGFYFGTDPSVDVFSINSPEFTISMRNVTPSLGFSVAVQVEGSDYTFADRVFGPDERRKVELFIVDDRGLELHPNRVNAATGPENPSFDVSLGAAVRDIQDSFLLVDLTPEGGEGFVVAFATDLNGGDAMIPATGQDQGCNVNEILDVRLDADFGPCPEWSLIFGPDATEADFTIADDFPINMRNARESLGFSFGVSQTGSRLSFADEALGQVAGREVEIIITDDQGISQKPNLLNEAVFQGEPLTIASIEKGAAIAGISDDFFTVDLEPAFGGPGFTVGYAADVSGTGDTIPATDPAKENTCDLNEIVIVSFDEGPRNSFNRGDCDGNGKINVSDAAICAQNILLNRIVMFDCQDMLDANDDGELGLQDPIAILNWVFLNADDLNAPFRTCSVDDDENDLGCLESNCTPNP